MRLVLPAAEALVAITAPPLCLLTGTVLAVLPTVLQLMSSDDMHVSEVAMQAFAHLMRCEEAARVVAATGVVSQLNLVVRCGGNAAQHTLAALSSVAAASPVGAMEATNLLPELAAIIVAPGDCPVRKQEKKKKQNN